MHTDKSISMFKDKVRIKAIAGKGGNGKASFYANRKPSGGVGGDGANVFVVGALNEYDLSSIPQDTTFKGEDGIPGGNNNLKGRDGKDLMIKVPLVTKVYDKNDRLIMTIDKIGEPKPLIKGGRGGLGNYYYRTTGVANLDKADIGKPGKTFEGYLQLELYSDVIFIGFPNAGKSSILNSLTNAESKVDSYAFTTINPQLGRMDGYTLMDLPGLIEGTHEGKGLGTSFVKHTKASKLLAHFITLESEDILGDYRKMRAELEKIGMELINRPEIIILTKSDLVTPEQVKTKLAQIKKINKDAYVTSVYDLDALEKLKKVLLKKLEK